MRWNVVGQRPIASHLSISSNGELLASTGEINEALLGIKGCRCAILIDSDDCRLAALGPIVNAQDIDDLTVRCRDGISLQPAVELAVEPA